MKVLTVVGARPQFIKAAPVSAALAADHTERLVHTGQHYDEELSAVFFEELGVPTPAYNLGVGSGSHASQTGEMMTRLDSIVASEAPDTVLVYGDTNSTLAAALVAAKHETTVTHVEAGLRSGNWRMPEEVNRVVTDHCSDLLLTPSESAVERLSLEGITDGVYNVGDVMYDAVLAVKGRLDRPSVLEERGISGPYVVATVHRPRNTGAPDRLAAIVEGLASLSHPVVFPVHPRTESALREYGLWEVADEALTLVDPLSYVAFVGLLDSATCVVTDSGGVQKEAFYLGTPCVTVREETEWHETVDCGWNVLCPPDADVLRETVETFDVPSSKPSLYGDGDASGRVAERLGTIVAGS
jgi:UDP-N-acetylglucosamine 2-epimerase (non-hydrolysing)